MPRAVADVEDLHILAFLQHTEDHAIDVGPFAMEQVPQLSVLGRNRTARRAFFKSEKRSLQSVEPTECRVRLFRIDCCEDGVKIALSA